MKILIGAMRGRSDGDWYQSEHNQRLEVLGCEYTNSITSVQKDNYVIEIDEENYDVRAVGRQRTEEEKRRRHIHGDKGAKFSQGKQMCLLGDTLGTLTTLPSKDNLICEIYER